MSVTLGSSDLREIALYLPLFIRSFIFVDDVTVDLDLAIRD